MLKELQKKYPKLIYALIGVAVILIIINDIFITSTFKYKKKLDITVFTFNGENELICIDDGMIIITPNRHQVFGGNINYIGLKDENIKFYSNKLYLKESQNENIIMINSVSFEGNDNYTSLKEELKLNESVGEISSITLFNKDDLDKIKDHLFFEFKYEGADGDIKTSEIKLNVKEYHSNL